MAVVIVATVGSATANSFVTLAEAQAYVDGRLNTDLWTAATTDQQNRALVEATIEIHQREYNGRRVDAVQVLNWPRFFCPNPDAPLTTYWFYLSTTIPDRIKNATCELALQFIVNGTTDIGSLDPTITLHRESIGGAIDTEYEPSYLRPQGLARFPRVLRYIKPLLADSGSGVSVIRG